MKYSILLNISLVLSAFNRNFHDFIKQTFLISYKVLKRKYVDFIKFYTQYTAVFILYIFLVSTKYK